MTREKAALMAREFLKLTHHKRARTLKALDTDTRILVIEEMYRLKGDCPPGKIPNCS
jgi:hypothetical protein